MRQKGRCEGLCEVDEVLTELRVDNIDIKFKAGERIARHPADDTGGWILVRILYAGLRWHQFIALAPVIIAIGVNNASNQWMAHNIGGFKTRYSNPVYVTEFV